MWDFEIISEYAFEVIRSVHVNFMYEHVYTSG